VTMTRLVFKIVVLVLVGWCITRNVRWSLLEAVHDGNPYLFIYLTKLHFYSLINRSIIKSS